MLETNARLSSENNRADNSAAGRDRYLLYKGSVPLRGAWPELSD